MLGGKKDLGVSCTLTRKSRSKRLFVLFFVFLRKRLFICLNCLFAVSRSRTFQKVWWVLHVSTDDGT